MIELIQNKLAQIEKDESVRILLAVESGSRAWGFESPDSDYDVRFIYVHSKDWYLKLDKGRDVIEWQLDETLDINGWDITKALGLLRKSNMTLFEWNNSPIVYKKSPEWNAVEQVMSSYFNKKDAAYHYLSTAQGNYEKSIQKYTEVKLKKYLYVLRPLLAAAWSLEHDEPPPMLMSELVARLDDEVIKTHVQKLIDIKMGLPEIGKGPRDEVLDEYIEQRLLNLQKRAAEIVPTPAPSWDKLNEVFLDLVAA